MAGLVFRCLLYNTVTCCFQDSVKEIAKLSEFLGLKTDQSLMEEIADKCEFQKMKKEKNIMENKEEWLNGEPGMYRKGKVTIKRDNCAFYPTYRL